MHYFNQNSALTFAYHYAHPLVYLGWTSFGPCFTNLIQGAVEARCRWGSQREIQ